MLAHIYFTAVVWESERGWGRKIDEVKEFKTKRTRDNFIKKFNAQNTAATAPDWYMFAEEGKDVIRSARSKAKPKRK